MNKNLMPVFVIAPALFLGACGGGGTPEAKKEAAAPPPAAAPAPADDANAATISGKVSFAGTAPTMRALSMDATPACARQHTTPVKSQEVVVGPDGSLKNVFVYVKAGLPERQWPAPAEAAKLDQKGCMYS